MADRLVSIVIPCYNAEASLERCVMSITSQTYKNIEVIIINDGSRDRTKSKAEGLAEKDARIKVYNNKNLGVSHTRNFGIEHAEGSYIMFIDADDYIEKNAVEKMLSTIETTHTDLCLCGFWMENGLKSKNKSKHIDACIIDKQKYVKELFVPQLGLNAFVWNRLYKIEIIRKHNIRFCEDIYVCEDTLFNFEYAMKSKEISYANESLYHYCINDSSVMFSRQFNPRRITAAKAYERILEKADLNIKEYVEVAAAWYFEIVSYQALKSKYRYRNSERKMIKEMLEIKMSKFMKAKIPIKYKIVFPLIKLYGAFL